MKHALILGSLCLLLGAFKLQDGGKTYEQLKPHMRVVYQSLVNIFPYSFNKGTLLDRDNTKIISENLQLIAEHSAHIQQLVSSDEKGHAFLSYQLERNAQQALIKYKAGLGDQAQFYIEELYDTCLSCHTSRTSGSDSVFAMDFAKDFKADALGTFGKARFLSLSRQFEKALDEYERIFNSESLSLEELLHYDPFVDYLVLAIRVKEDRARVIKTFSTLKQKPMPLMVKNDLEAWVQALTKIAQRPAQKNDLVYARSLLEDARSGKDFPRDRGGLVYYITASKLLRDHLNKPKIPAQDKAETYFQLGIAELGIGAPYLTIESGLYFEESIKLAPKAAFAKKAFALYEENLLYGYSGSSGVNLPEDERTKLEKLRKLVF
ncbi:MAG: hypothetical protein ACOVS5_18885 [Oligoflexus sp.]|jgi:hypothetical protein